MFLQHISDRTESHSSSSSRNYEAVILFGTSLLSVSVFRNFSAVGSCHDTNDKSELSGSGIMLA